MVYKKHRLLIRCSSPPPLSPNIGLGLLLFLAQFLPYFNSKFIVCFLNTGRSQALDGPVPSINPNQGQDWEQAEGASESVTLRSPPFSSSAAKNLDGAGQHCGVIRRPSSLVGPVENKRNGGRGRECEVASDRLTQDLIFSALCLVLELSGFLLGCAPFPCSDKHVVRQSSS